MAKRIGYGTSSFLIILTAIALVSLCFLSASGQDGDPTEACCLPDGQCADLPSTECLGRGGVPKGAGTSCSNTPCQTEACCIPYTETCEDLLPEICTNMACGTSMGPGTSCATVSCPPVPKSCCFSFGRCEDLPADTCIALGGSPGEESCAITRCPYDPWACCLPNGQCIDNVLPSECEAAGGTPIGPGATCWMGACPAAEACCWPSGDCDLLDPEYCSEQGGTPRGAGTDCQNVICGPVLTSLTASYEGVFVKDISFGNTYTATVDWNGYTPQGVVFELNGTQETMPTHTTIAQKTYDMGQDLRYSLKGAKNTVRAWAVAKEGSNSKPLELVRQGGLELPEWAISEESKKGPISVKIQRGKIAYYGEIELLKSGVKGTVNIPEKIPQIGGKWGVEIDRLNLTWELAAEPRYGDGAGLTGSFLVGGQWKAEAECGAQRKADASANITGAAEFYPEFRLTDVSAQLAGSGTFLFPRAPLLCAWTSCCNTAYCPYFQAGITAAVSGTVSLEQGTPALLVGLKFKQGELNLSATLSGTVGVGSEGSIYYAAGGIGGTPYVILQFPGNPSSACLVQYVKEAGVSLGATVVAECAWWKRTWEWNLKIFKCPEVSGQYETQFFAVGGELELVPRDYLGDPEGYCVFPATGTGLRMAPAQGLPSPILNVGTGPCPSVATSNDAGLLVFVYDDATKPTGKHQEIYWARWDGSRWTAHAPLTDNNQPDLYPTAAIDAAGRQIVAWVQAPEPTGMETGPRDILAGMEVVASSYDADGGAWSVPQAITANAQADLLPWFEQLPSGELRVCWISSAANAIPVWHDEEIAPLLDVMAADWDGNAFGSPYLVAGGLQTVSPPSIARSSTYEFMTYLKDMDNNSGTADDREVMVRSRTIGGEWSEDVQLTNDAFSDTAAQIAVDQTGTPMVAWVKRMVPVTLPDRIETHVDQLWFSRWQAGIWGAPIMALETDGLAEPKLIRSSEGRILLFWVAGSKEFSDIYYSVYDDTSGQWGRPQQITHDPDAETMLSLAESGGNILAACVKRRIDLTDPSHPPEIGLSDLYLIEHVPARDLSVSANGISFDPSTPVRGQQSAVRADIHLAGDFAVTDVRVDFFDGDPSAGGRLIDTRVIAFMLPGETVRAEVMWAVPIDDRAHDIHVIVNPAGTIPETDDLSNNRAITRALGADLIVGGPHFIGYATTNALLVGVTIGNAGQTPAGESTVEVRRGNAAGPILFTTTVPTLQPGETASADFTWDVSGEPAGAMALVAIADAANQVDESVESNNLATVQIPVQPDLEVQPESARARRGLARIVVRNVGVKPSQATVVRVSRSGQLLGEAPLAPLPAGAEEQVSVGLAEAEVGNVLKLTVNPDSDGSDEGSLLNNSAEVVVAAMAVADFDLDGDVDQADLTIFSQCVLGPAIPYPTDGLCVQADFDHDGDVDQTDFGLWQRCFSGTNKPADPNCGL